MQLTIKTTLCTILSEFFAHQQWQKWQKKGVFIAAILPLSHSSNSLSTPFETTLLYMLWDVRQVRFLCAEKQTGKGIQSWNDQWGKKCCL